MGKKVKIVVASDLHYLAPDLQDHGKAFTEMMVVSDGRLTDHSEGLLDEFVEEMKRIRPDVLILTGDLTFNAEKISHEQVSRKLFSLAEAGIPVLAIPGNHDLDNPLAGSYLGEEARPVESITKEQFAGWYHQALCNHQNLFGHQAPGKGMISRYPSSLGFVYAVSEKLWILAIDVNGNTYPGEVSRGILVWAEGQLKRAKEQGITVIGISHQNLMAHNLMLAGAYQMIHADKLMELYRRYQVKLHLSGHMHIQHIRTEEKPEEADTEITEIVTSSLALGNCQYGLLTVGEDGAASYHTETVKKYSSYGEQFFLEFYQQKILWELRETRMQEEITAKRLARGLAVLNLAYYKGRLDLVRDREEIRAEWKKEAPESFWNDYLDSFMEEIAKDHTSWSGTILHFHNRSSESQGHLP